MESGDPQRRWQRHRRLLGGRFLIPTGSRHASALGLRRRINRRAEPIASQVTINLKINRSNFNAGRGINLSTNAGIPHPLAIREEWQDEDSDRVATVTDLHRHISNESDTDPKFNVDDDESRFNNLNPHSMLLMHEATICDLHNRVSTLETQLERATGTISSDKKLTDGEMFLILLRKYYPPIILFR